MLLASHGRGKLSQYVTARLTIAQLGEWMGVSLLAYFAPVILQGIGTSEVVLEVLSGVLTTCMFLGTIPLYWCVSRTS